MSETTTQQKRVLPQSDLDFGLMVTDSVWGKKEVPAGLQKRLGKLVKALDSKGKQICDKDGNPVVTLDSLWELLGFYTRDMRLANLSTWNGEFQYCQYFLDLAGDLLQAGSLEPFLICLSRVATVLELSQSKGGFLRRRMNTFTQENTPLETEPKKKSLFGVGKQKGGMS